VDANAFDRDYKRGRLPNICSRVSVYFNRGDVALAISDATKGNPDRLGHDGPERPHQLPAKVVAIDCSEVAGAEHSYYLSNASVRIDIQETLAGKEPTDFTPQVKRIYTPHSNRYLLRKP
jgi:esterase/lipase superfamily enzyme